MASWQEEVKHDDEKHDNEKHDNEKEGLRVEVHGVIGEGSWFRLYECEHISDGSYPMAGALAIGSHTNLALCRHCWQQHKGAFAEEMLRSLLKGIPQAVRATVVKGIVADQPGLSSAPAPWDREEPSLEEPPPRVIRD